MESSPPITGMRAAGRLRYVAMNGASGLIAAEQLDLTSTIEVNRRRGVTFNLRAAAY